MHNDLLQRIKQRVEDLLYDDEEICAKQQFVIDKSVRNEILRILVSYSDQIPYPGSGNKTYISSRSDSSSSSKFDTKADTDTDSEHNVGTLLRWQILAYVAGVDLTVAKWFESHLDALSILYELGYDQETKGLWAIWAAEGHPNPVRYRDGKVAGVKTWCSGANMIDYALMTYRDDQGHSQLITVDMKQRGIEVDNSAWQAVGMQATDTASVTFDQVEATQVGEANAYLDRVGFWHGAAGVAACWYGATARLAQYLLDSYQHKPNDYKAMYLGEISTALSTAQNYLYSVADLIDAQPSHSHEQVIRQLRAQVELVARQVLDTVGLALGAAPFCSNAHFATLSADLTVFIRQSHAAFDLKRIGELAGESAKQGAILWKL